MSTQTLKPQTKYNTGIDLLRIVAMFMVVTLHVAGAGGVLSNTTGIKSTLCWLVEIAAYGAVNIYALISGYVSYREDDSVYSFGKYIFIWSQVVFYSVVIFAAFTLAGLHEFNLTDLIHSVIPATMNKYWYFTAYTGVFFIIPWLNKLIKSLSFKDSATMVVVLLAIFSCYTSAANLISDPFAITGGYSLVWITVLYLAGAWIKKHNIPARLSTAKWMLTAAAAILFTWLWHTVVPDGYGRYLFVSYISPTVVIYSIALISAFSRLDIAAKATSVIKFFAPATFAVYIIHTNWILSKRCIKQQFIWIADMPAVAIPFMVLICAAAVLIICMMIEKIRTYLFKVLKINFVLAKIQSLIDFIINKIFSYIHE